MVLSFKKGSLALAVINVFGFVIQTKLCAFGEKVDKERDCSLLDNIVGDKVKGFSFCDCVDVGDLVTIGDAIKLKN